MAWTCKVLFNIELLPLQIAVLRELWTRTFPMLICSRGGSKTWSLAVYCLLKTVLFPDTRAVIVGAAFRQSKLVFEYMEEIWKRADILRSICTPSSGPRRDIDRCTFRINDSITTAIPLGTGEKIRGLRANLIVNDEFACLAHDTLIQTDRGLIKIKDFLNGKPHNILNMDGEFEYPKTFYITPKTDVYKITTANGYSFKCSEIHQVWTLDGWKLAKDLTKKDMLELDNNDYFPENYVRFDDVIINEDMSWLLGLLVSEGTVTNRNYIQITNTDKTLINKIKNRLKFDWKYTERAPLRDNRGWDCKRCYSLQLNNTKLRGNLYKLGLDYVTSHEKTIPSCILQSPRSVVIEFLRGLFEGDGSGFKYISRGKKHIGISYYSVNEELVNDLQILLLKFNISCTKVNRRSKLSENDQWMLAFRAENAIKIWDLLKLEKWEDLVEDASYLVRKPFIREKGKKLALQTTRANRNVHIGMFNTEEECQNAFNDFWDNAKPVFRIKSVEKLDQQEVLYDFEMPKTHSFIGNGFIQHNSINPEIYETIVAGFTAVSQNPVDNVKEHARRKAMKKAGVWSENLEHSFLARKSNQSILSGTASYDFNHFASYWKRYHAIIEAKGDKKKLQYLLGDVELGETFEKLDWRDFSIIRIPYELYPPGFMDEKTVMRAMATMHAGISSMEFNCVFSKDSMGFFRRSLIESIVANESNTNKDTWPHWCSGPFDPKIRGSESYGYVYGIDPAAEEDNFAVVILEIHPEHQRLVHVWTTNRTSFKERQKAGLTDITDYFAFCTRKVRDFMRVFPCLRIGIDTQGGGHQLCEALHDPDKMYQGELALWPVIEEDKEKETDDQPGLHIIEMINFSKADWTAEANHGLRKDMEDKILLFPRFDSATLSIANVYDQENFDKLKGIVGESKALKLYDTLEDCALEIESLKDELSTIVMTQTGVVGRDRWDTPEVKLQDGKKGRLRKDRYSALVIANMLARQIYRALPVPEYKFVGAVASRDKETFKGQLYHGGEMAKQLTGRVIHVVRR